MSEIVAEPVSVSAELARKAAIRRDLLAIAGLAPLALADVQCEFSRLIEGDEEGMQPGDMPWSIELTTYLNVDFQLQAKRCAEPQLRDKLSALAEHPDIHKGHSSIAAILDYASPAFVTLMLNERRDSDVSEFVDGLRRSSKLARFFADRDAPRAELLEGEFRINDMQYGGATPHASHAPFRFIRNEDNTLDYVANPEMVKYMDRWMAEAVAANKLPPEDRRMRCPALGMVIEQRWQRAIDFCLADPSLFQRDFSTLDITWMPWHDEGAKVLSDGVHYS